MSVLRSKQIVRRIFFSRGEGGGGGGGAPYYAKPLALADEDRSSVEVCLAS